MYNNYSDSNSNLRILVHGSKVVHNFEGAYYHMEGDDPEEVFQIDIKKRRKRHFYIDYEDPF
jgi:hypothetical protein